jgi:UDP-N-acetylmuramate: L-alanyl-gamma-D-glutamyl-meso-diaminopimelate ligase
MHIHILGICGTFMAGIAVLASELKLKVTGADQNVYPPMSTQLNEQGIKIFQGYEDINQLTPNPDCVVVGNVMRRGIPVVEAVLNQSLPMFSGPEWLARNVLHNRHVLAVSGTHGKTTTSSMLAWILEYAGKEPGFLIGGIPNNFGLSARLGKGPYFVVEADEYDSAFFDKRSKFVHYRPRTLIVNNIEFDHADIFADLAAIQLQFHHLVRTVPGQGLIVRPSNDPNVDTVLKMGCWTPQISFGLIEKEDLKENLGKDQSGWTAKNITEKGDQFEVCYNNQPCGEIQWSLLGQHNIQNALAAIAAAYHVGIAPDIAVQALAKFKGVKRRMEIKGEQQGIIVYDDFAHHPTAIHTTLAGLRAKVGRKARIVAVVDIRSNTMRAGHHKDQLAQVVQDANQVYFFRSPDIMWDVQQVWGKAEKPGGVYSDTNLLLNALLENSTAEDHVLFMSNGGFNGIQTQFLEKLKTNV